MRERMFDRTQAPMPDLAKADQRGCQAGRGVMVSGGVEGRGLRGLREHRQGLQDCVGGGEARPEAIFMEAIARPRTAKPAALLALQHRQPALRFDGGEIEDGMRVLDALMDLRLGNLAHLGFSDTTTGCCQGSGCRRFSR